MSTAPTLSAGTLPGSLLEVAQLVQNAEQALDPVQNKVTVTFNTEQKTVQIAATLGVSTAIGTGGVVEFTADDYLP